MMNFLASSPSLELSGANVLLAGLFRGFSQRGHGAAWLVTSNEGSADSCWLEAMGLEFQILPRTAVGDVTKRQRLLIEEVKRYSQCIYFPNYDFDMLWAAGALPPSCRTVFIMHCDDPVYYEAIQQRGSVMDAIVCVSAYLASEVKRRWPELASRVHHIPFGVELPDDASISKPSLSEGPLEVVYCGRLVEEQKRIGDLARIILECHSRNLPVRFHIAGCGPEEGTFFAKLEAPITKGMVKRLGKIPHDEVSALLASCHAFILTSAYEGLPVSLLEAMAHGCVPIVTAVSSGIPEVIDDGVNGFMLPIGDTEAFSLQLEKMCADQTAVRACAEAALATINSKGYSLDTCLNRFLVLCASLSPSVLGMTRGRDTGRCITPPSYRWHRRIRARLSRLLATCQPKVVDTAANQ